VVVAASAMRRTALEALVKDQARLQLVGAVVSFAALSQSFRELPPDVVLVDLPRPDPQFLNDVRTGPPLSGALVLLLGQQEPLWNARALRYGVRAILDREANADEICAAIDAAHQGMVVLEPALAAEMATRVRSELPPLTFGELTAREVEVLRLLAEGRSNKELAAQLEVSDHTVKFHISSILDKLGAASRTEAVTLGVRKGLIALY